MNFRLASFVCALAALVSGCQSTSLRSAWFDTSFAGPPMRKIMVAGAFQSLAEGRVFEDIFVEKMRAAGVDGVASHTVLLDPAKATDAAFDAAVIGSGAQGLLLVNVLGVDTRTQVSTSMAPGGMAWGRGPWGGPSTTALVPVQRVSQYDLATVETKLFDVKTRRVVWAGTTTTLNPQTAARETPAFADIVIGELKARGIVAGKP
ncbi:MAG: DUF4136 domain-containing protein [Burkholderiales bacterium]|nr:DUF4136 domain-containing protein [Burkholderiales bacterium]